MHQQHDIPYRQVVIGCVVALVIGIGLFGIVPQISQFSSSWQVLQSASLSLVFLAFVSAMAACCISGIVYHLLSLRPIRYRDVILVQYAGLLVNRVLPAGVGGMGLNFVYLHAHKHSKTEAGSVVALNNTLGLFGHATLVVVSVVLFGIDGTYQLPFLSARDGQLVALVLFGIAGIFLLSAVLTRNQVWSRRLHHRLSIIINSYASHPFRLLGAYVLSGFITSSMVVSLWFCCHAIGLSISLVSVFIVATFGVIAATATPTPGGLGGAELGVVVGLHGLGVTAGPALAAALLFRLVSYWVGLPIGLCALLICKRRNLI